MAAESYYLGVDRKGLKRGYCHVTYINAIVLVLFVLLIIAAVAVLVYFIPRREGLCNVSSDLLGEAPGDILGQCKTLASANKGDICDKCNERTTASIISTTNASMIISTTITPSQEGTYYRLPDDVVPVAYDLEIKPDIYSENRADFRFEGKVDIRIRCERRTSRVTLHADRLDLVNSSLVIRPVDGLGDHVTISSYSRDSERQFLVLTLSKELDSGREYFLHVEFSGPITRQMSGLYYSTYRKNNDEMNLRLSMTPFFKSCSLGGIAWVIQKCNR